MKIELTDAIIGEKKFALKVFKFIQAKLSDYLSYKKTNNHYHDSIYICNYIKHYIALLNDKEETFDDYILLQRKLLMFVHLNKPKDDEIPEDIKAFINTEYDDNMNLEEFMFSAWFDFSKGYKIFKADPVDFTKKVSIPIHKFKLQWVEAVIKVLENHKK